jgi:cytoskeletal protein CcmA (bactofilin family)
MKMKMKVKYLLISSLALLLTANTAQAAWFKAEQEITIQEEIFDDVYLAGERITVEESVAGDVLAIGQSVTTENRVGDDVIAAGERVEIKAEVQGDVIAAGETVRLGQEARVGGEIVAAGRQIEINGEVEGNVRLAGSKIIIGPNSVLRGNLTTYGQEPTIADGALIEGERQHYRSEPVQRNAGEELLAWVASVMRWFVLATLLLYFWPVGSQRLLAALGNQSVKSILIGVVWLILAGPSALILMVSSVGLPLGLVLALLSVALGIIAHAFGVLALGYWFYRNLLRLGETLSWQQALTGAVILELFHLIPGAGWLLSLALVVVVSGVLLQLMWQQRRA